LGLAESSFPAALVMTSVPCSIHRAHTLTCCEVVTSKRMPTERDSVVSVRKDPS
jgi:hypothetical protein